MYQILLAALVLLWIIAYMVTIYVKAKEEDLYALFEKQLMPMSIVFLGLIVWAGFCGLGRTLKGDSAGMYGGNSVTGSGFTMSDPVSL